MPFVPFTKKSAAPAADPNAAPAGATFSKTFARKRKPRKVAPAQKALMNPGGRSLSGGSR